MLELRMRRILSEAIGTDWRRAVVAGLLTGALAAVIAHSALEVPLERQGLRLLFLARGEIPPPRDVVVISFDEKSASLFNESVEPIEWPRYWHACLVDHLRRQGVALVVFDMFFGERRSPESQISSTFQSLAVCRRVRRDLREVSSHDLAFAAALSRATGAEQSSPSGGMPAVLLQFVEQRRLEVTGGLEITRETIVSPVEPLRDAATLLAPFVLPRGWVDQLWLLKPIAGVDTATLPLAALEIHVARRYDGFPAFLKKFGLVDLASLSARLDEVSGFRALRSALRGEFARYPSLRERILRAFSEGTRPGGSASARESLASLKTLLEAYDGGETVYLNFYGSPGTIPTLSLADVLTGTVKADLRGKTVFVGASDPSVLHRQDSFGTVFATKNKVELSGVEIAATAFANLLSDNALRRPSRSIYLGVLLLFGMVAGIASYWLRGWLAVTAALCLWVAYFASALQVFTSVNMWLPVLNPSLQVATALLLGLSFRYLAARRERAYIAETFSRFVPVSPAIARSTRSMEATIMFTDMEGFTGLGERLEPETLREVVNVYFEVISEPIEAHGGEIMQYQGDAILAVFHGPDVEHAAEAVRAASGIQSATRTRTFADGIRLNTRIGISTGVITMGPTGSERHASYVPQGDWVNVAARLEPLNKDYGTNILVAESTVRLAGESFPWQFVGEVPIRGKRKPVSIYTLKGDTADAGAIDPSVSTR